MDVKEFYETIGGDYQDVFQRLMKDDRIVKFVKRFPGDESMESLEKALKENDFEGAFNAAHTMKGITANLSLKELNGKAEEITELLRGGKDFEGAKAYFPELKVTYNKVVDFIAELE